MADAAVRLLGALDAFYAEHRRCGELDAGVEGPVVWFDCECAARIARRADSLTSTREPPHYPGMDRRRFLLTSVAGALAVPLAAEGAAEDTVRRQAMDIKMGPRRVRS